MESIIKKIIENKLLLKLEQGKLKVYKKDNGSISAELLEEIRNNKAALEDYLLSQEKNAINDNLKLNIPKLEYQENYELSSSQRRLWILNHFEKGAVAYNIPSNFELNGNYNIDNFKKAINALVERHEILRTVFKKDEEGEIKQWVLSMEDINFNVVYLDLNQDVNGSDVAKKAIEEDEYKPFDLEKGPLFRVSIFKLSDEKYILYFNMHHIIGDAWSMEIIFRDTFAFYDAFQKETAPDLPELRIHYKDYAVWQQEQIRNGAFEKHKTFWKNKFTGDLPLLDLPGEKIRPKTKTYNGYKLGSYVAAETTMKLESYCKANGGSLYIGLVALWNTLFYKYTGQKDIVIGAPIAGRNHIDLDDQVGFYINTLPLRNTIDPSDSFDELFHQIKSNTLESFNFQQYPFDLLTEDLNLLRNPSRSAMFDVIIGLPETQANAEDFVVDPNKIDRIFDLGEIVSKVDLAIIFSKVGNHLFFDINFNTDVYEREMIERLIFHFKEIAAQIVEKPSEKLGVINYLSPAERTALLSIYPSSSFESAGLTVLDLFRSQVMSKPDTIAYSFGSQTVTYKELDLQSDRLGHYLRDTYKLANNDLVGIMMDTNEWSILCLLGILKSGAGYVCIDKELPEERKGYIIEDASIKALLILSDDLFEVTSFDIPVFSIDLQYSEFMDLESDTINQVSESDTAYVIYTSGTTGKPKGVMVSHSNVVDYYLGLEKTLSLSRLSRFGLMSSLSADLGKTVVYGSLLGGGTLYGFSRQMLMDAESLKAYITKEAIDCIKIVPSHWKALSGPDQVLLPNAMIIFGGEVLSLDILDRLSEQPQQIEIVNHYGPTETTIGKLLHQVSPKDSYTQVPVGKPFSSTVVYIVNEELELCPFGISGELLIGGLGVAKGYVNNPELTAKQFIANPFGEGLLYRTGDKVRMRADGEIVFLGRIDDQVKIRGYRVEPHEIATVALSYDFVNQCIVLADEDSNGYKRLVCYLVPDSGYNEEGLKSFLQSRLPDYMVPGIY
ncbi:non-ribosomal peptide synthetase, partial [Flavobacterium sp.]|uniref:non-ribosomal peptide synthetase n=1 Tax=Flavobacterium sp. TaxID=239 RepID=UPI003D6BA0BE